MADPGARGWILSNIGSGKTLQNITQWQSSNGKPQPTGLDSTGSTPGWSLNFKKLYVSVLPDAWIDLYLTKKKPPLFMAKGHFWKKVKHFSVKQEVCMFIVCTSSHNRDNFCCICSGVPCAIILFFWSMYKYIKLNTIRSNIIHSCWKQKHFARFATFKCQTQLS